MSGQEYQAGRGSAWVLWETCRCGVPMGQVWEFMFLFAVSIELHQLISRGPMGKDSVCVPAQVVSSLWQSKRRAKGALCAYLLC